MKWNINVPLAAFSAFAGRLLIHGSSLSEALVLLVLAALYGYDIWAKSYQAKIKDKEWAERIERELTDIKSSVAGVKLGAATMGVRGRINSGNGPI